MKNQLKGLLAITLLAFCLSGCEDALTPGYGSSDQTSESSHVHVLPNEWDKDEAYHWKTCSVCKEIVDKKEHTFGEWVTDKEPSESEKGHRYKG